MNSYDWGGFPNEDDEPDDTDEAAEREAHEWARNVMNDSHWERTKEEW